MSITTILQLQFGEITLNLLKLNPNDAVLLNETADYMAIRNYIAVQKKLHGKAITDYGGDYRTWLDERSHTRTDHKYTPGAALSFEDIDPYGEVLCCVDSDISDVEFHADLETALSTLTDLQRYCFVEICIKGREYKDVSTESGKKISAISEFVRSAKRNLKKYFN
jgi:uncharacterized protein YerC